MRSPSQVAAGRADFGVREAQLAEMRDRRRAREALGKVGLTDRIRHRPNELSGGQQQRVAIARALALNPKVLLFDEPTSALDPISAQRIEQQLLVLKEKMTIVVVTHQLRQAHRLADHVIFLWLGELVESGPAAEIFKRPKKNHSSRFVGTPIDRISILLIYYG